MKKIIFILLLLATYKIGFSQQKYDDGPITGANFVVSGTWGRNNITFSFLNGTTDIANDDERNAVRQAFQLWSDYANLNITEVASNGDIRVSWQVGNHGDGNPFDGLNGVLAHAFFPPPAGGTTAFAGDVHFDDDETWTLAPQATGAQPIDLVTVAAHEIGHALGLGHSNVACALMNAFYTGSHRYLSQDDIDGMQSIYGNRTVVRTINFDCTGGTLFINNLPTGASVFWTSSNNLIATVANNNNQGIVSRVGSASGNVRITGTITLPCGTTVVEFIDLPIGVPNTDFSLYPFSPNQQFCTNAFGNTIKVEPQNLPGVTDFQWGYSSYQNGISPTVINNHGNVYQDFIFSVGGNYQIFANEQNACGIGGSVQTLEIFVNDNCNGGGFNAFSVSPNPASSDVQVASTDKKTNIKEIRITDKSGNIKKAIIYSKDIISTKLDISFLPSDIYYIQIFDGKKWNSKTIRKN